MASRILRRIQAARDAEEIASRIAEDSLEAALRFLQQTEDTLQFSAKFPGIGGLFAPDSSEFANVKVWRVKGFPNHVIFFKEHGGAIEVLRILHGAMDIEAELRRREY